jgi:cytoskeleton protein RodZ
MTSLGETLRRARLKRNLELNRIADELKISAAMLRAIEEERFDKLPGGVFARSFIRQYARLLEVDESEIEGELTRVLEPPPELPQVSHHQAHLPEAGIPMPRMSGWQAVGDQGARWSSSAWSLVLVVLVMLACAGAYAWWQRERRPVVAHQKPPVAEHAPAPDVAAVRPPAAAPEPATAPVSAPSPPVEAQTQPAPPAEAPAAAETAPSDPNPDAAVRVEVVAQEPTWIWVRTDGQYSFSGVLDTNQTRTLAANRNVVLKIGNAAGVEVRFNGKAVGPFGGKGAVRTIQFTSGGFQIVPPEVPKPAPPTESPKPL